MIFAGLLFLLGTVTAPASRNFEATYVATVEEVPAGLNRLEVWVPLPHDTTEQIIRDLKINSSYPGEIRREKEFGNSYFYFSTRRFLRCRGGVLRPRHVPAHPGIGPSRSLDDIPFLQ